VIGHWGRNGNPAGGIGQWRKVDSPPAHLNPSCTNGVVVKGGAYFFFDRLLFEPYIDGYNISPRCIPSFNLETEQWSVAVQEPIIQIIEKSNGLLDYKDIVHRIMLGEHKDFLVTVHYNKKTSTIDLWFLMDVENSLWSRQHIVQIDNIPDSMLVRVQPVLVLDEGRIILLVRTQSKDWLRIYSPGISNATLLQVMTSSSNVGVGIYTGSLLC